MKKIGEPSECVCTRSDGLFIPNRQLSTMIAFLLMVLFVSFLSGYFFGKKHMVEQFVAKAEQDSFADQIYSSLCALGDYDVESIRSLELVESDKDSDAAISHTQEAPALLSEEEVAMASSSSEEAISTIPTTQYLAQLIGFGTEGAARRFYRKMKERHVSVIVKERVSVSAKGNKRTWYQVVTEPHEDRDILEKLVDRITKEEKLMGVRIVTC